jgi:hypothetical protein
VATFVAPRQIFRTERIFLTRNGVGGSPELGTPLARPLHCKNKRKRWLINVSDLRTCFGQILLNAFSICCALQFIFRVALTQLSQQIPNVCQTECHGQILDPDQLGSA